MTSFTWTLYDAAISFFFCLYDSYALDNVVRTNPKRNDNKSMLSFYLKYKTQWEVVNYDSLWVSLQNVKRNMLTKCCSNKMKKEKNTNDVKVYWFFIANHVQIFIEILNAKLLPANFFHNSVINFTVQTLIYRLKEQ